jgi:ComF family protein
MIRDALTRVAGAATEILYPRRCVSCGLFGTFLCEACAASIEPGTGDGRCGNCSARWSGSGFCPRCTSWALTIDAAAAASEMSGPARALVHALKYGSVRAVAPLMAARMESLRDILPFEVALPVPLHPSRERGRGFNQAALLLAEVGWPRAEGGLRRVRKTKTQVGQRAQERARNVSGAFVYDGPDLAGRSVVLVDDVVTTGATVLECASVLREHGARRVYVASFARASYGGEEPPRDV